MSDSELYRLLDITEDLDKVNGMIRLHSESKTSFSLDQYLEIKEKLVKQFILELKSCDIYNKILTMKTKKKITIGEYIVVIEYDLKTGSLEVNVLDELEDVIESITITNDDENEINPNLN